MSIIEYWFELLELYELYECIIHVSIHNITDVIPSSSLITSSIKMLFIIKRRVISDHRRIILPTKQFHQYSTRMRHIYDAIYSPNVSNKTVHLFAVLNCLLATVDLDLIEMQFDQMHSTRHQRPIHCFNFAKPDRIQSSGTVVLTKTNPKIANNAPTMYHALKVQRQS